MGSAGGAEGRLHPGTPAPQPSGPQSAHEAGPSLRFLPPWNPQNMDKGTVPSVTLIVGCGVSSLTLLMLIIIYVSVWRCCLSAGRGRGGGPAPVGPRNPAAGVKSCPFFLEGGHGDRLVQSPLPSRRYRPLCRHHPAPVSPCPPPSQMDRTPTAPLPPPSSLCPPPSPTVPTGSLRAAAWMPGSTGEVGQVSVGDRPVTLFSCPLLCPRCCTQKVATRPPALGMPPPPPADASQPTPQPSALPWDPAAPKLCVLPHGRARSSLSPGSGLRARASTGLSAPHSLCPGRGASSQDPWTAPPARQGGGKAAVPSRPQPWDKGHVCAGAGHRRA